MIRPLRRLLLALPVLAASQALADPAPPPAEAPYAAVRTLQSLQEQVAHGDAAAQAAQPKLMAHIADVFLAADPTLWREPRNTRAAVLFLLSGGKPPVVRTILSHSQTAPALDRLLKGALAYGEGQDDVARMLLDSIDPRTLPSGLGGQVALVQAALQADLSPGKASRSLDFARLLMPGTLVEEAALRRQIFLLSAPEAIDKFALLSRQYIRRFRASVYAANFRQRFAATAVRLAEAGDVSRLAKLEPSMTELPGKERRRLYLAMAKAALTSGKTEAARFAAARAADPADDASDYARAKLYDAAARVASDQVADGLAVLKDIEAGRLSNEDAVLREAAVAVGETVRAPATPPGSTPTDPVVGPAAPADTRSDLIEKARGVAAESDKLLQAAPR